MTNFVVGLYVARTLGLTDFGIFTLAWVTYGVILNVSRGLGTDPLVVRFSGVRVDAWCQAIVRAGGTALCIGLVAGALSTLVGLALHLSGAASIGAAFIALGIVLPGLLLQDSWRFGFFAAGIGRKAFANDIVWAVALVPALLIATQLASVFAFVLAWGLSGALAAAFGCLQARLLPRITLTTRWLRQQRDLGTRYLFENVSNSGASQLRMYGVGAIAGLADVGIIRGANLLLGPFLAVLMGLSLVAVPEAARVLKRSRSLLLRFCALLGGGQAAAALAWGVVLLFLLPDAVGEFALGTVWEPASALIVPATLTVMNASIVAGAAAGLRAIGAARMSLRAQLVSASFFLTGGLIGAAVAGATGSAWGVAAATMLESVIWWVQLRRAYREFTPASATSYNDLRDIEDECEMRIP